MKQFSKDLGNVCLAPKGKWSREQEYERLNLVYNACDNLSYVAKIDVPIGVEIDNREYWQPMNATGYADNNFINLTTENENGTITAYETLEEAVATILPINRKPGAILSFFNLNADRLDRQAEFELWQFNSTDLANWENRDYWNNIYYNWNVFVGWYVGADGLKNHVKIPNVGQYAYVGTNLNDAILYQCRTNGVWTNTGIKVRNYISVVVGGNITIGDNGNWFSDGKDTGIPATPAVDEQLDNIIMRLQQHDVEISNLKKSDANLQDQITSNDNDITNLNTKHESLSRTVQGIAATGGASTASNVTYNNDTSGLNAENAQDAIDELQSSKFDKTSILQELGEAEDKVMSQKAVSDKFSDLNEKFYNITPKNLKITKGVWKGNIGSTATLVAHNSFTTNSEGVDITSFSNDIVFRTNEGKAFLSNSAGDIYTYIVVDKNNIVLYKKSTNFANPLKISKSTLPSNAAKLYVTCESTSTFITAEKELIDLNKINSKVEEVNDIKSDINDIKSDFVNDTPVNIPSVKGVWKGVVGDKISFDSNANYRTNKIRINLEEFYDNITFKTDSNKVFLSGNNVYTYTVTDKDNIILQQKSLNFTNPLVVDKSKLPQVAKYIYVTCEGSSTFITAEKSKINLSNLQKTTEDNSEHLANVDLKIEDIFPDNTNVLNVLKKNTFVIESGSSNVSKTVIPVSAPYLVKGFNYRIILELSSSISINNGKFILNYGHVYDGFTVQIINIPNGNTSKIDVSFICAHEGGKIDISATFNEPVSDNIQCKIFVCCIGSKLSMIDDVSNCILSDTSAFLISYTRGALQDVNSEPGKLRLGISTDGLHFHKLSNDFIFDGYSIKGKGFLHDIDIIEKNNIFYIIATSSNIEDNNCILTIFSSENLLNWSEYTTIRLGVDMFSYNNGNTLLSIWAPEILELNDKYYLSFAVCEKWITGDSENSIIKGYIADLSVDFKTVSNIRRLNLNSDRSNYTFDISLLYANSKYYAMSWDCAVYMADDIDGSWTPVGILPAEANGFKYMEGATLIYDRGWFYIYGDGTRTSTNRANNLICWKTKDFKNWQFVDNQFDEFIRHPKIITLNCLHRALAENIFLNSK